MRVTFSDENVSPGAIAKTVARLAKCQKQLLATLANPNEQTPLTALKTSHDKTQLAAIYDTLEKFGQLQHIVLIGIGGSSLGTEAIHAVLANPSSPQLHILDTVAPHELNAVLTSLQKVKRVSQIAICVVSKSGNTVETLANAESLLGQLQVQFGTSIWRQVVAIGNEGTDFLARAKKRGAQVVTMPTVVGGRYSVFTSVGLVPLGLLGHDLKALLAGVSDATTKPHLATAFENAARLYHQQKAGARHYNFFAFDTRLVRLGKWYRQLMAESLGKETTRRGKKVVGGFLPTISTTVDLHSVGQLYLAKFPGVYTDFVTLDDQTANHVIPARPKLAAALAGHTHQDIATALRQSVLKTYQARQLPYRSTVLATPLNHSLGFFMATRMLETMALAELMDINAFDQPNVELYKKRMRKILKI